MTQREEFEAWADSYGLCCEPLTRESVEYDCFEAYKAGQAAQPVQPSQAVELSTDDLNRRWELALASGNPTAGDAHLRYGRGIIAAINAKETK